MHPEMIKAGLRMKGISPAALADELNVSTSTMSLVINGKAQSRRIKAAIALRLGQPVDVVFPKAEPSLKRMKVAA